MTSSISHQDNGDKQGTPVVIKPELYSIVSKDADEKGISIRKYVNDLLLTVLKRYKYLRLKYPSLEVVSVVGPSIIIKEGKDKTVLVNIMDDSGSVFCLNDKSDKCDHAAFARLTPEINKALLSDDDFFTESDHVYLVYA